MAIEKVQNEHHRLSILLALAAQGGYETNDSMLQCACEAFGHRMSNDKVRNHVEWLKEQGLVTVTSASSYLLIKLTERGQDVSEGRASCPGVKRPRAK